ncbi:MAG TPA: TIGR01777 family oxidoreductase [Ohtaekwangia sp.]|nr:TIGR01777 family oxidoreductase [Ohtaekwangia sp.]
MPKNVLITGASGLIGSRLTEMLRVQGHAVAHLSRSKKGTQVPVFTWDVARKEIESGALENTDTIIHLAGAGIGDQPWTERRKKEILESRTLSTRLLYETLARGQHNVTTVVSASAVGYYGSAGNEKVFTEDAGPGNGFLADVVTQWEAEADRIKTLNIRVVKIRTGIVLSEAGGVLKAIMKPVRFYLGAPLGSGNQYLSWIHLDDLCRMYIFAVENASLQGACNATAPGPVTNRELTATIAQAMHKPMIFPAVPSFLLKLFLGEMADLVLYGSQVSPQKILDAGFRFRYTDITVAVEELVNQSPAKRH